MVLDNSTDAIVLIGLDYSVLAFNQSLLDTLKAYSGRIIKNGEDYRSFVTDQDKEVFHILFQKAIHGETTLLERHSDHKDISLWFEYRMSPTYDHEKNLLGVCLRAKNIDTRKKMEIALVESEQKFRNLIESAPNAILIIDTFGKIVHCNLETENTFGFKKEELINQSVERLVPFRFRSGHDLLVGGYISNPIPMRIGKDQVTSAVKKDGTEILVEISLNGFEVNQTNYVSAIIVDITEKIQIETRIKEQLRELKEIARIQSHEIRRPLANILGLLELLESEISEEKTKEIHSYLRKSANDLDLLVCDIVKRTNIANIL
ncbi:PAS domain S-box protein [Leptospira congkakensis]|uniref:histidine kinase n=2 Tax=Leptospira congkakensis TaxID=2484932 RepID=A0A4Z1AEK4_9LEPT|nr:PAS domain S-box protein [Leptospira congkakensis]TGL92028.1 PAS domain S-box protein [Leptospira congkakensis]TGL99073.1 PAS domain S-box protein [Leptospira congkakensis]